MSEYEGSINGLLFALGVIFGVIGFYLASKGIRFFKRESTDDRLQKILDEDRHGR